MRLDVYLTPGELTPATLTGRTVVVLDVLRASTSIVEALSAGAKSIFPVASIEEALRLANNFGRDEVLLAGERRCLPIEGFDLGNSPTEYTRERVAGKILVMTTTNGTAAMSLTTSAARVFIGSMLNLRAVVAELVRTDSDPVLLCAGRETHFSLEDAACAGEFASRIMAERPGDWALNDGAHAALTLARSFGTGVDLFEIAAGGRSIVEAGLADDLEFCARTDVHDIVPVLQERNIKLLQPLIGTTS
ncbi:MAG: 2-phosphosulfolactate phosphatase family protein [Gemmatimonas sp.]|nr:2-phosphosulfolactate phosphatase family protein [Gemmatimonas sp.]